MNLEKVTDSLEIYHNLVNAIRSNTVTFIYVGLLLKKIRDDKLYLQLGEGGYDSFVDFVNNPELGMRYPTAMLYIRVAEYYHLKLDIGTDELSRISLFKLMRLLPVLKKKDDSESREIIKDVGNLTNYDFDALIKEEKWESTKPVLSKDKQTGLYNITFYKDSTSRIYEANEGKLVWEKDIIDGEVEEIVGE